MFILKIIVVSSAILNIGSSSPQCNSDNIVSFQCLDPKCIKIREDESTGRLYRSKKITAIVGFNNDTFLVKNNKGRLSIVPKNDLKVIKIETSSNWKFNVSINKNTFEICESNNYEENNNGLNLEKNIAQVNKNSDEIKIKENDVLLNDTQASVNVYTTGFNQINEESDNINNLLDPNHSPIEKGELYQNFEDDGNNNGDEDDDGKNDDDEDDDDEENEEDIEVEDEIDSNSNQIQEQNLVQPQKNSVNENVSSNNIQNQNSDPNNTDKKDSSQNNIFKTTGPQNEYDSPTIHHFSTECTLNSCVKDISLNDKKEFKENIATDESHSNISSDNSSNLQNSDQMANNHQTMAEGTITQEKESILNTDPQNLNQINLNNFTAKINETQKHKTISNESLSDISKIAHKQVKEDMPSSSLGKEKMETKEEINSISDDVASSDTIGNNSQKDNDTAMYNETQKQPANSDLYTDKEPNDNHFDSNVDEKHLSNNDNNEFGLNNGDLGLHVDTNDSKESEIQSIYEINLPYDESTPKNNVGDAETTVDEKNSSPPLQKLVSVTENNDSLTDHETTISDEVNAAEEISSLKPNNQCTLENGCSSLIDSAPKYDNENIQQQYKSENKVLPYEGVQKTMDSLDKEKAKDLDSQSIVMSFGHPETCSGISCLKFKRNVEKIIKPVQSLNAVPKQDDSDTNLHSENPDFEHKIIVDEIITEQSSVESSFFDCFQHWLSSPTLNSIEFLSGIFGDNSEESNDIDFKENNENKRGTYENHLLTLLAAKDQNLLIVEKELSLLKEQSSGNSVSTIEKNSEIETLNDHLTQSEDIMSSQAIRIEKLEQEVEELTESGLEMHTLLSSALESSAKNSEKLNSMKMKLVESENLVAALTQKNFEKTAELDKKIEIIKTLQNSIDELTYKNVKLVEDVDKLTSQHEQLLAKNMLKESKLLNEINNLQMELDQKTNALVTAENEIVLSKEALQEILSQKFNPSEAKKYLSSMKSSTELKSAKQMCEEYKQKLNESVKSNRQCSDLIDVLKSDIVNFKNNLSKLEKEKEESENKLLVITKFFQEQQKEYLKEINEKMMVCDNKERESSDLDERLKFQSQEITIHKSHIQTLKKEITDQEASFKIQLSAANKKASDHWISFKQAERKLKEMELETAQLRNKLTMVDKKLENGTKSIDSSKDFEDELLDIPLPTVSPDFTLLDFEPPPPIFPPSSLQHASVDQRLPPLGALGQAPSPPVPLSRRHNRSLSPISPPPTQRSSVFRPLPQRYNYMNRQNSLGHSVESLDK